MRQFWLFCCVAVSGCGGAEEREGNQPTLGNQSSPAPRSEVAGAPQSLPVTREGAAPPTESAAGLCGSDEEVIFQCSLGREIAAVCAGSAAGRAGYVQYRYGSPERIELAYPGDRTSGPGSLSWARTGYSGGGEAQIRFVNAGHEYVIYSRIVRTGFGADGQNEPKDEAGLFIRKGGKLLSEKKCVQDDDAGAQAPWVDTDKAEKLLPEGEVVYPED